MFNINPVFKTKAFWELYCFLESETLEEVDVEKQLNLLERDFPVNTEIIEFEYQNKKYTETNKFVEFGFDCGSQYSLLLVYSPSPGGCDLTLFLSEKDSGEQYQLGWWDLARWHPFCLKPDEFELILKYWKKFDPKWQDSELPLLLLYLFVGLEDVETAKQLSSRVKNALSELGIDDFEDDPTKAMVCFFESEQFSWKLDENSDWVFTGEDYNCYSLRNKCHSDGEEEGFPFGKYKSMIAEIRRALEN